MAQDDDDAVALLFAKLQATPHQGRADPLMLAGRQNSERCQGQRRHGPLVGEDRQVTEQGMADHLALVFSDQGHTGVAAFSQRIDQAGLIISTEGEAVDLADGVKVSGGFKAVRRGIAVTFGG